MIGIVTEAPYGNNAYSYTYIATQTPTQTPQYGPGGQITGYQTNYNYESIYDLIFRVSAVNSHGESEQSEAVFPGMGSGGYGGSPTPTEPNSDAPAVTQ